MKNLKKTSDREVPISLGYHRNDVGRFDTGFVVGYFESKKDHPINAVKDEFMDPSNLETGAAEAKNTTQDKS